MRYFFVGYAANKIIDDSPVVGNACISSESTLFPSNKNIIQQISRRHQYLYSIVLISISEFDNADDMKAFDHTEL
jgi:hypothetical protein